MISLAETNEGEALLVKIEVIRAINGNSAENVAMALLALSLDILATKPDVSEDQLRFDVDRMYRSDDMIEYALDRRRRSLRMREGL